MRNWWGGDSIAGQAKQVLENLKQVLAEVGAGPEHVVRLRTYLVDHTTGGRDRAQPALARFL